MRGSGMNGGGRLALVAALLLLSACSGGTKYIGSNDEPSACSSPAVPPAELALDPFYERYLDGRGIPVVSSENVSATALERACVTTVHLLDKRADVRARLAENGFRVAVIGVDEVLTELPEYRDLDELYPDVDWDYTIRSLGAGLLERPVSTVGEENLLCSSDDPYAGESIAIHSIAHGLRSFGIVDVDPPWDERLEAAYEAATRAGLWEGTFAATDASQYWAEGVQGWYDANLEATPADGLHNEVDTRRELKAYDPELWALIAEYVPEDDWRPACLAGR
ncbi:MAG TPA: hypothetical protein VFZ53_01655 [Polyangiaceae bacterium]